MAGALAAFFGSPLGGSLFALEVCSRFGVEYFEHTLEAILCGEITLTVFRTLSQVPPMAIWDITINSNIISSNTGSNKLTAAFPIYILYGAIIGLIGAGISIVFGLFHKIIMATMARYRLLDHNSTVQRALVGACIFVLIGILVPQTLFWSEEEFQNIAIMDRIINFPHVWPPISITGFEMHNFITASIVGIAKLITISFSIAGGFRGGVIFPLFACGAAFGRAFYILCPFIPVQICVLCFAAAIQVPITRTALSTSIILTYLSGEPQALAAILAASLVSLFCTVNTPVLITTQVPRLDLDVSIHHHSMLPSPIIVSTKTVNIGTATPDCDTDESV
jgi:H+/Cl- antiporter ClcA